MSWNRLDSNAVNLMTYCLHKLGRYIHHKICKMLLSNATIETPATTAYLDSKIDHM